MDRINGAGHVGHMFVAEDVATNRPPTEITEAWLNSIQEELAAIVEFEGGALNSANNGQVLAKLQALFLRKSGGDLTGAITQKFSGLYWQGTPVGGAFVRKYADIGNAATVGGIEDCTVYNVAVDPATGVWAGRDVADICWLEKWSDVGGVKEFWYAPTAAAGVVPAWVLMFSFNASTGVIFGVEKAGMVAHFATSTAPSGWLKANGAAVSRTTYASLFTAIGTVFGIGNGSTTFNLPDLRGEFVRSWDDARGIDTGRAFGSPQSATLISARPFKGSQNEIVVDVTESDATSATASLAFQTSSTFSTAQGSVNFPTRPRNIALLTCIKY